MGLRKVVYTFLSSHPLQNSFQALALPQLELASLAWSRAPLCPLPILTPGQRPSLRPAPYRLPSSPFSAQPVPCPAPFSFLRTFPAGSDPGALTPACFCTCCSLHPDSDFRSPTPNPVPRAVPLGKPSLGTSTSSTLGPTSFPASPRPETKACANTPGTGPGTRVERALGLGTARGRELSGAGHSATVGIGCQGTLGVCVGGAGRGQRRREGGVWCPRTPLRPTLGLG